MNMFTDHTPPSMTNGNRIVVLLVLGVLGAILGCTTHYSTSRVTYEACGSDGFRVRADVYDDPHYHYSTCIPCSQAYPTDDPYGPLFICTGKVQKP